VNPVVTAAAVVTRLQDALTRLPAADGQVTLTVGTLRAGTAANVIPDRAERGGAVRAASDAPLDQALAELRRARRARGAARGAPRGSGRPPTSSPTGRSSGWRWGPRATPCSTRRWPRCAAPSGPRAPSGAPPGSRR